MKHTMKKSLALLLALLLALPGTVFADDIDLQPEAGPNVEISAERQLDLSDGLTPDDDWIEDGGIGDLQLDLPGLVSGFAVNYRFIVDGKEYAVFGADEGDRLYPPQAPDAPAGMAFDGWFLTDGTRLFTEPDGSMIARGSGDIPVHARFVDGVDSDPQKPSPSGGPSARESVQWTDSSEDGSADPREGAEQSEADEVVPPTGGDTADDADTDDTRSGGVHAATPDADTADDADTDDTRSGGVHAATPGGDTADDTDTDDTRSGGVHAATPDGDTADETDTTDPQKPSPSGGPSAGESVQWTDSSEDGSADPRDGAEQSEADEVVPPTDTTPTDETQQDPTSPDTADAVPPSPEGEGSDTPTSDDGGVDAAATEDASSPTPVTVIFNTTPEYAVVTVQPVSVEAPAPEDASNPDDSPLPDELTLSQRPDPVSPGEGGGFALLPGEYTYAAQAEGYIPVEGVAFTVAEEPLTIDVVLEKEPEPEPVPFDQSATVNGVVVTVRAEPGAFPADARLVVRRVPTYRAKQAGEAIEEVRDEDLNVADSYTFDVKVIDPATGDELQPAGENTVEISFSLAAVADENLTASIYHITGEGGDLTAEKLESDVDGEAVTATTDGFSYYTVELTYNTLQYVLEGGGSVALAEILESVGLTGEVEAVAVSDASLFDAVLKDGAWVVESHRPFDSEEWMKVTINGLTFEIAVTDRSDPVEYVDADGNRQHTQDNVNYVQSGSTSWSDGWYAVTANTTIESRVTVDGDVHLILCDGATLTTEAGITVQGSNSLTIYGQSKGTGALVAGVSRKIADKNAGIGGIGEDGKRSAGRITINGGTVTATGSVYGAGIGGGYMGAGGNITIRGGTVTATGSAYGAGIGGGKNGAGGKITITGGKVEAKIDSSGNGAGIGGGDGGAGGTLRLDLTGAADGDYLKSSSYNCTVNVEDASGKPVYVKDVTRFYTGELTPAEKNKVANKELKKAAPTPWQKLQTAIDKADTGTDTTTIKVSDYAVNGSVTAEDGDEALVIAVGQNITLDLNGCTLDRHLTAAANQGNVITVNGSLTLTDSSENKAGTITGGNNTGNTGGVLVNDGATFTMTGGTISGNTVGTFSYGGGVYVFGTGKFNLSGGTISGNTARYGGGVVVTNSGTFNMKGGTISGNTASESGGGVYVDGGEFSLSGGTIGGTTANTAQYGGGVYVNSGTFTMNKDTTNKTTGTISGNTASENGGGVYVDDGEFSLSGGTISGNTASGFGGGVVVTDSGTFNMKGGTIGGTTADANTASFGGGVYVANSGTFEMKMGTISGNTATNVGGGVCVDSYFSGTFNLSGAPQISGNKAGSTDNNVYLSDGNLITVDAALSNGASIGVSMETPGVFTKGSAGFTSETARQYFTSDNAGYAISVKHVSDTSVSTIQATLAVAEVENQDGDINGYATFEGALAAVQDAAGVTLRLLTDVTTGSTIVNYRDLTLDLNGYGIRKTGSGSVIDVPDGATKLTLTDSAPTRTHYITLTDGRGTAVSDTGTESASCVKVTGGYITGGNVTDGNGGGVCVEDDEFAMTGGTIIGNTANAGGGVYVSSSGKFSLSGKPTVTGNTGGNVYLPTGKTIAVTGALSDGAKIGVTMKTPGVFTTGYGFEKGGYNAGVLPEKYFFDDSGNEAVGLVTVEGKAEAALMCPWKVLQSQIDYTANIQLTADVKAHSTANGDDHDDVALVVPAGKTVILDLNGHKIDRALTDAAEGGNAITVKGSLTVTDTAGGGAITGGNNKGDGGGVIVNGGALTLKGRATITGNTSKSYRVDKERVGGNGGGVYVNGGAFTMTDDASVSGNEARNGGGVAFTGQSFTLSDNASISGNTAARGGGVAFTGQSFTLSGNASITGNRSQASEGGGVWMTGGTFDMTGGAIAENKGTGGVWVCDGTFNLSGGTISKNNNAGVRLCRRFDVPTVTAPTIVFNMTSGTIAENDGMYGGGIWLSDGTFNLSGGAITGNTAIKYGSGGGIGAGGFGGGVFIDPEKTKGEMIMTGGEISGNTADQDGGGVHVYDGGAFTMTGGKITGNTAKQYGGGVCVDRYECDNIFTLAGGGITGNTASLGGGVYVGVGVFSVSGAPTVADNKAGEADNNVFLTQGNTVGVAGQLNGASIGVTTEAKPEAAGLVTLTSGLKGNGDLSAFTSDDGKYTVGWNDAGTEAVLGMAIEHSATGYTGNYDGEPHGIAVKVTAPASGATVKYGERPDACDKDVLEYTDAGEYTVYYQVTAQGYFPVAGSAVVKIDPAEATVTVTGKTSSVPYDGKEHTVSGYTAKADTDLYDVAKDFAFSGTATAAQTDAGKANMGLKASQFKNTNANFSTVTFNVTDGWQEVVPAEITISADDKASRYGEPLQPLTWQAGGAYIDGDDLGVNLSTTATTASDVGEYPIRVAWNGNPNYTAELIEGKYTVTKGAMTLSASGYSGEYDGMPHGITVSVQGEGVEVYYGTNPLTDANYATDGQKTPVTRTEAGETTVYYYAVGSNYEAVSGSKVIEIRRKTLTVKVNSASKTYGEEDPPLTYTVLGLAGNAAGDAPVTGSLTRDPGEDAGRYAIRQGTLRPTSDDFTIAFEGAFLTIAAKAVTPKVVLEPTVFTYDGKPKTPAVTLLDGDRVIPPSEYGVAYSDNVEPGTATVTIRDKEGGNYVFERVTATFTIIKQDEPDAPVFVATMTSKCNTALRLSWNKVDGADGYEVYFSRCNGSGKAGNLKLVATVKAGQALRCTRNGLKKGVCYKSFVKAYSMVKGKKVYVAESPLVHAYAGGQSKNHTDAKAIRMSSASRLTLKVGKSRRIRASVVKRNKLKVLNDHASALRWYSSNPAVATVDASGRVTAVSAGKCTVTLITPNGIRKDVKVKVK